jgi:hypothetical protein
MGLLLAAIPAYSQANPSTNGDSQMTEIASVQSGSATPPMLRAGVEKTDLGGSAEEESNGSAQPHFGNDAGTPIPSQPMQQPSRLNAQVNADPDRANPELMLAWDKWRNKFAHSVWQKYCETLDPGMMFLGSIPVKVANAGGYAFPPGLKAVYTCTITGDRHISYAQITSSSGDPQLDAIILDCVRSMDGKRSLAFPKGSVRQAVMQREGLSTGATGWHTREYSDVERVSQRQ